MFRCCNNIGWTALALLMCIGCEDPRVTKYTAPREKNAPDFTRIDSYDKLPDGWKRAAKPVELSVATFQVGENNKTTVTISRFPGNVGGLPANIERWRGKVGLPKATDEQLLNEIKMLTKMLMVGGEETPYVDLSNPDKKEADRILGVFAERGSVTWVFKMQGPPDEVGAQQAAFEKFVGSIKFGGIGANDG